MQTLDHQTRWLAAMDQLYDSVGREQRLAEALGAYRPFFGAQAVSFFTAPDAQNPSTSHTGAVGMNDQMLIEYHAHFGPHDEWVNAAVKRNNFGTGAVYRGTELVDAQQLQQSYFGRHFLARHGVTDVLAAVVETGSATEPMSWTSFHRVRQPTAFTEGDAASMAALAPHMRQVLRLHRRLAPQLAVGVTLREMVQRLETPFVFVGADGRITDRNTAAEAALDAAGGWLCKRGGRLFVASSGRWQDISTWLPSLRKGTQQRGALVLDLVNEQRRCAALEILPIQGAMADVLAQHPALAICTLKPGARDRTQALQEVHGLTPTEARVAVQLASGRSAGEIAAATKVSLSTVRSHLAEVRGKLGVRRQGQIVSAVLEL